MHPGQAAAAPTPGRSLWRRVALVGGAIALLAWPVAWLAGSRVATRLLVAEAESHFAARVEVGRLDYWPPFWVVARDVVLTSELDGERIDWVRLPGLRVTLAGLPFAAPALWLAGIAVEAPIVTVVRTGDGLRDASDLWRGGDPGSGAPLPLQRLSAAGARLRVLDRRTGVPAAPLLELGGFTLEVEAGSGAGRLAYTLSGGDGRLAADSTGTLDVHERTITIDRLDARVRLAGAADAAPGGGAQPADVELYDVRGAIQLAQRSARIDDGTLTLGGAPLLKLGSLRAQLSLGDGRLEARDVAAQVAGGSVSGAVVVHDAGDWRVTGEATGLDLGTFAQRFPELGGSGVRGKLSGSGWFAGVLTDDLGAALDALHGEGRMLARDGAFYQVPLVAKLLEQAHLSSETVTLSNAAASFRIAERTIHLDNAALGSPSVGVQGHGEVAFDGRIELDVVVVPLGDWRQTLERSNVPVVGRALASVAGKVQALFGKASAAIYEFHITGTVQAPRLTPVPVPVLTREATSVFSRMVTSGWSEDVLAAMP